MASVNLDRVWLALASDPDTGLSFRSIGKTDSTSTPGDVRRYSNGRLRLIRRPGPAQTIGVTARLLTREQTELLQDLAGQVVLLRDNRGRKLYGVYLTVDVDDLKARAAGQDVTLQIQQVTYSEAV